MYDSKGNLTRAGAEQVIKDNGVVHLRGADGQVREYKRLDQLPSEAEFALGDPSARQKALDGLKAQREQLDEQERKLLAAAKDEKAAREDADKAQKERERREKDNPQAAPTLHQQVGGRPLSGAENPLAAEEANATAKAAQQRQPPQRGTATVADADESPVSDSNAAEAVEQISHMRARDKLQAIADNDKRATVKAAAQKRLSEL